MLIVSDAFIEGHTALTLHPALLPWHKKLKFCGRQWFSCDDKIPLEWYAVIVGASPAALLAASCNSIPADTKQCWVASPYSGQLGRDQVRVMPEGAFPWCEKDAQWLCNTLNPLLEEEGMHLLRAGVALLLACDEPMHVRPPSFAMIAGKTLPNHHPEGEDGGRLMRLISEIQMSLHGKRADHRAGQPDIHGLWLWGESTWPVNIAEGMPTVATRNPFLQAVANGKDAKAMITEAERMGELVKQEVALPRKVALAGEGYAVLLTKALLPRFGKVSWIPKSTQGEAVLLSVLRSETAIE